MKKMMMTLMAAVMICSAANAQSENESKKQEMIKHRTERTVKQYNLNDKQAKQLLELNTKYADKMHPRHHGPHGMKGQRPMPPKGEAPKGEKKGPRPEGKETMKAYDVELQKIMTAEQFKSYKADMEKMREKGPRPPRRQHPQE